MASDQLTSAFLSPSEYLDPRTTADQQRAREQYERDRAALARMADRRPGSTQIKTMLGINK